MAKAQPGVPPRPLRILQISSVESGGGAATVAANLQRGYRERGCDSWLAVGRTTVEATNVLAVPDDDRAFYRVTGYAALQAHLRRRAGREPGRGWGFASRSLRFATHPRALLNHLAGREDFEFAGTRRLLELPPSRPDILHAHNLHGAYFDLRELPRLSHQVPTLLTLHDTWLLAGHCAYSFDCDRWKTGCGQCPDLTIDPAIRRDGTAGNWRRKRDVYARSRLYISAPCRWVLEKVEQSMLAPAVRAVRIIPNGVDLAVYRPGEKRLARSRLGLSDSTFVILVVAAGRHASWRDGALLRAASGLLSSRVEGRDVRLLAVGHPGTRPEVRGIDVRFDGHQPDAGTMAGYYQAADVYLHPARTDTFPTTVLEALACGTPVVGTNVGGIAEQVRPADVDAIKSGALDRLRSATGVLVPASDAHALADALVALLTRPEALALLGLNGAHDARERFDVKDQIACYLDWYRFIIDNWAHTT